MNHRSSKGELTPTLTAEADELIGIARAIGTTGQGVLQAVSDFNDVDAEFALFRSMAEASGRPLSFTLLQTKRDSWRRQLELLDQANADGVSMRAQVAPRAVGLLLGLECTLHPLLTNPVYREIAGLPLAERVAALADPAFRARVFEADRADRGTGGGRMLGGFDHMFELGDPPDYEPQPASSIEARAQREGRDPFELAYDIMLADGGHGFLYRPVLNYDDGNLDAAGEMLAHDHTVVGLGDGGAHVGTICDASFPTTLLALWGRDRDHGRLAARVLDRTPDARHRAHRRTARSWRRGAGVSGRRQRDRRRAADGAAARDPSRPAGRRSPVRAAAPTATSRRSPAARSRTRTARRPGRCRVG